MSTSEYRTLIPLFDELRSERITVRPYRESDAEALQEAVDESREYIRPWLPFADAHQTVEESRDWIIQQEALWLLREDMIVGLWENATGRFLGGSGLHIHDWRSRYFEIGYWLRPSAAGHGYMTEAVQLLTDYAFDHLEANRVQIRCDERNIRSAAIPRRLGFVLEGILRDDRLTADGQLSGTMIFSLIRRDRKGDGLIHR